MAKNIKISILVLLILACLTGILVVMSRDNTVRVNTFDASKYKDYIKEFSSEEYLGFFSSTEDLLKEVETIWVRLYGESVRKEKPYQVFYDEQAGVWLVRGTLHTIPGLITAGGVPYILVEDSSGKVLAVWHEK